MDHIDQMSSLRQSIGLQSYAQIDPLREYQNIGYDMFTSMISSIEDEVVIFVSRAQVRDNTQREEQAKITGTSGSNDDSLKRKPVTKGKDEKVGRNDPCPCGSGLKYKHCCGKGKQKGLSLLFNKRLLEPIKGEIIKMNGFYLLLENKNPSGSIKFRPALEMFNQINKEHNLQKSDTIIETTSGNMGIALAYICDYYDINCVIVMPEGSKEKIDR